MKSGPLKPNPAWPSDWTTASVVNPPKPVSEEFSVKRPKPDTLSDSQRAALSKASRVDRKLKAYKAAISFRVDDMKPHRIVPSEMTPLSSGRVADNPCFREISGTEFSTVIGDQLHSWVKSGHLSPKAADHYMAATAERVTLWDEDVPDTVPRSSDLSAAYPPYALMRKIFSIDKTLLNFMHLYQHKNKASKWTQVPSEGNVLTSTEIESITPSHAAVLASFRSLRAKLTEWVSLLESNHPTDTAPQICRQIRTEWRSTVDGKKLYPENRIEVSELVFNKPISYFGVYAPQSLEEKGLHEEQRALFDNERRIMREKEVVLRANHRIRLSASVIFCKNNEGDAPVYGPNVPFRVDSEGAVIRTHPPLLDNEQEEERILTRCRLDVEDEFIDRQKKLSGEKPYNFEEALLRGETPSRRLHKDKVITESLTALQKKQQEHRGREFAHRLNQELITTYKSGWYCFMNTLTVSNEYLGDVFGPDNKEKCWKHYIKAMENGIRKTLGDHKRKLPTRSFHRYACVTELGSKHGRPHYHVVHMCKALPSVRLPIQDPMLTGGIYNRKIRALCGLWPFGISHPTPIRTGANDIFGRMGWTWPYDEKSGLPVERKPIASAGRYISKYLAESYDDAMWKKAGRPRSRTKLSQGLGLDPYREAMAEMPTDALLTFCQSYELMRELRIPGSQFDGPQMNLIRREAIREWLKRKSLTSSSSEILEILNAIPIRMSIVKKLSVSFDLDRHLSAGNALCSDEGVKHWLNHYLVPSESAVNTLGVSLSDVNASYFEPLQQFIAGRFENSEAGRSGPKTRGVPFDNLGRIRRKKAK